MIYFAFALASLIFIIPAIYFIPSDLTKKGKKFVTVVSILIGMLGLTAKEILPEWQAAFILVLLILTGTYLANNKMNGLFHAAEEAGAVPAIISESTVPFSTEYTDEKSHVEQESVKAALPMEEIQDYLKSDIGEMVLVDFGGNEAVDRPKDLITEELSADSPEEKEDINLEYIENLLFEEIHHIETEQIDSENDSDILPETFITETNYLAELEEMINEDDSTGHTEEEIHAPNLEAGQSELKVSHEENEIGKDEEYIEILKAFDDSDDLWETGTLGELDSQEENSEEYTEMQLNNEAAAASESQTEMAEEANAKETIENQKEKNENTAKNQMSSIEFQNEMFQLIAPQLELARNSLDKESYEKLVLDCMNPNMQPSDYYTFARLLFDHYIIHKEFDKLIDLAGSLEKRFSAYPVLVQEIQFIQNSYAAAAKRKN